MSSMRNLAGAVIAAGVLACGARSELGDAASTTSPSGDAGPDVAFACAPLTPTVIATNGIAGAVGAPHVAGGYVTWMQLANGPADPWNSDALEHIGTVYRVPTSGGVPVSLASFGIRSDRIPLYAAQVGFDAQSMYWAADPIGKGPGETDGAIMRASLDGSNVTTIIGGLTEPSGVVVGGGQIYFAVKDALLRANVDGSDVQTLVAHQFLFDFPFDATTSTLYGIGPNSGISSMPATGGQFAKFIDAAWDGNDDDVPVLGALSLSGSTGVVMMTTFGGPSQPPASGTIARWSTNGGALVPIASGFAWASFAPSSYDLSLWSTAIDGNTVYFNSNDSILRVPLAGGSVESVGPVSSTSGIAFDDARVYWTSYDAHALSIYAVCK